MGEKVLFLKNFVRNPRQIGSVIPSSRYLTKKMVKSIDYDAMKTIVELGAGTGPFTERIMNDKKKKTKFIVFEQNKEMRCILKKKFPTITIYEDAEKMSLCLQKEHIDEVDCIVSSIPFSVVGKTSRKKILEESYDNLKKSGKFITFQYSLDLLGYLKKKYGKVEVYFVPLNVPMAFVYVCTK